MWSTIGDDRWVMEQPDGSVNYLHATGGRLLELHVEAGAATLHEYTGKVSGEASPLIGSTFERSTVRPDLAGADADTVWAVLAEVSP